MNAKPIIPIQKVNTQFVADKKGNMRKRPHQIREEDSDLMPTQTMSEYMKKPIKTRKKRIGKALGKGRRAKRGKGKVVK